MTTAEGNESKNSTTTTTTAAAANEQNSAWADRILNSKFFNENRETKKDEKWGYDLYPERKQLFQSSISKILKLQEGREQFDKFKCEENVFECVKKSPLVKIMMGALKSAGW